MQLPIMAGITVRDGAFASSYPINLEPRAIASGMSNGELVSTRGAVEVAQGPGVGRGGISWNGAMWRVMGSRLVTLSGGALTDNGDVGNDFRPCGFAYSFDRLAIRSVGKLFYHDGATLVEVTDPDLGLVLDMLWMDGYFITTDGNYIVVTELSDPTAIDPIKYGAAEEDPDAVTGLLKFREELYVLGRYTIQVFDNVGGTGFPFQAVQGATIPFGCVSPTAKCLVAGDSFAFVGGAREDPLGIYMFSGGNANRISTREIDKLIALETYPEQIELETRSFAGEVHLIVHLSAMSIGIALNASAAAEQGAWFILMSGMFEPYRIRRAVLQNGKHYVDDTQSNALGVLGEGEPHFGALAEWRFDTASMFNDGQGLIIGEVELFGQFPTVHNAVFFSITRDGVLWSQEISRILTGRRDERVVWRPSVRIPTMGGFRFRGRGKVSLARCEVAGE